MVNLSEQIKILVELQGLDTQIFKLQDEFDSIPEQVRTMEEAHNDKAVTLKKHEDNVKTFQLKRKETEGELQAKEDTIKKYTSQMYQVKTNKEYTALQEEIGRIKADDSLIEEAIIRILDQIDEENREIAKEKDFLKKEEVVLAEEKKRLETEGVRLKDQLDVLKKQRSELAGKVEKTVLKKYERIITSKDGLAVVPVANDSCQGCFRIMPPQVINEIRMKADLVYCENCARILYLEE